jgi:hypothetical protein
MTKLSDAIEAYKQNDPPVEVDQVWSIYNDERELLRRIRIVAPDPDGCEGKRAWFYRDMPGGKMNRLDLSRIGSCPEINLRYVFRWEAMYDRGD